MQTKTLGVSWWSDFTPPPFRCSPSEPMKPESWFHGLPGRTEVVMNLPLILQPLPQFVMHWWYCDIEWDFPDEDRWTFYRWLWNLQTILLLKPLILQLTSYLQASSHLQVTMVIYWYKVKYDDLTCNHEIAYKYEVICNSEVCKYEVFCEYEDTCKKDNLPLSVKSNIISQHQ